MAGIGWALCGHLRCPSWVVLEDGVVAFAAGAARAGTGLDGFGWRLSIADIAESGGFSTFAGYQRVITVIKGAGMVLTVDGEEQRGLLPLQPFAFKGDSQVSCRLITGPIRDFNLIYSPQRYHARLQWVDGMQRFFSTAQTVQGPTRLEP